ncbi:MAG: hypothetical protein JRI27_10995 [Deltaproteobacteria bacterium]|nr:hypothetical protein [Deltaproteobacteria bacterium]
MKTKCPEYGNITEINGTDDTIICWVLSPCPACGQKSVAPVNVSLEDARVAVAPVNVSLEDARVAVELLDIVINRGQGLDWLKGRYNDHRKNAKES